MGGERIHNVHDRRYGWIGSWEAEKLHYDQLRPEDVGRTVIYVDPHGESEAGTLTSWRNGLVFARYSRGDTSAGSTEERLFFAIRTLDGDPARARRSQP